MNGLAWKWFEWSCLKPIHMFDDSWMILINQLLNSWIKACHEQLAVEVHPSYPAIPIITIVTWCFICLLVTVLPVGPHRQRHEMGRWSIPTASLGHVLWMWHKGWEKKRRLKLLKTNGYRFESQKVWKITIWSLQWFEWSQICDSLDGLGLASANFLCGWTTHWLG